MVELRYEMADFAKEAIEKYSEECDKIIFIGDEVDPYEYEGITRKQAIRTLEEIIEFKLNNKDKTSQNNQITFSTIPNAAYHSNCSSKPASTILFAFSKVINVYILATNIEIKETIIPKFDPP